ncbi:unnamed protein product [Gongylonema pulchrum]|uniref:Uncharacterized protein n=1 Tax=Gongylonema pulchrum TaxID=637853 RepID=A0A183DG02_9BILA|nr:unnamed protein product [Gongylonema pulchrum]
MGRGILGGKGGRISGPGGLRRAPIRGIPAPGGIGGPCGAPGNLSIGIRLGGTSGGRGLISGGAPRIGGGAFVDT